ncbi:MAG: gfo/Idh/MocA family oxidoreductase, partial [Pelagibacteraceae bacterium]|nr:gfo/Idh/MocA family oxidoreductase [Pelagibacteraceae bacterium]
AILNQLEQKLDEGDAVWNAKTLEAIQKSIETKRWVTL